MRRAIVSSCLLTLVAADAAAFEPYTAKVAGFLEQFLPSTYARWSPSKALKGTIGSETFSYVGKWETQEPTVYPGLTGDEGLVVTNQAAHHAISAPLDIPIDPATSDIVVQYEVKLQKGLECGGAYIKLLTESDEGIQASEFSDKTPYSIMFGPDKCGSTNKVHLILRHKSPKTGEIEEKHLTAAPQPKISKTTALYTLHLKHADQSYEIWINDKSAKSGLLDADFNPSFVPAPEIDDPTDTKPEDWVDAAKITDADATRPDDWDEDAPMEVPDEDAAMPEGWLEDEPATIPDPDAAKPEEWDDEEDGDWIAPSVTNPKCEDAPGCGPWIRPNKSNPSYKGKWYAPLIDNPLYRGIWKAAKIANPAYYEDKAPLANIGKIAGVGFEIWSMQNDILFDNIYVGSSISEAQAIAKATFHVKKPIEDVAEKADTKADTHTHASTGLNPDFKADPIGYIRGALLDFYEVFKLDPVYALKSQPKTAAVAGGVFATLVGMLGVLATLFSSKPRVEQIKKKSAETTQAVKETVKDKAQAARKTAKDAQETVVAAAQDVAASVQDKAADVQAGVQKRNAAGKARATEEL